MRNIIRDLQCPKEDNELCERCFHGKQHKLLFSSSNTWRPKDMLELIHIDFCGPMRTPSLDNKYFIIFIDDFSKMTWVYFIKENSEVFKIFKKFKTLVEKQTVKHIKDLGLIATMNTTLMSLINSVRMEVLSSSL